MTKPTTLKQFETVFPKLVDDLSELVKKYGIPENGLEWFRKSLVVNTVGGKCNRGMSVVDTYSLLLGRELNENEYFLSATLGWCTELLQAYFLVADDIMDSSKTRRGQPCWYLQPNVGMIAINDSFMLEMSIYMLLKKYFRQEKCYVDLLELFQETTFQTEVGQLLDLLTAPEEHVDLSTFSLEKYRFIVIYKTAYYSFYLPVALALHLAGFATPETLEQAKSILIPLGEYFQVQDDYLDAFGDPAFIGKIGTDIQDNKCSWLVNTALAIATPEQRKLLDENYGKKGDAEAEKKVKDLYKELGLEQKYRDFEEERVKDIRAKIAQIDESTGLKRSVLESFVSKIYKRDK